jgi:hypothetical protein
VNAGDAGGDADGAPADAGEDSSDAPGDAAGDASSIGTTNGQAFSIVNSDAVMFGPMCVSVSGGAITPNALILQSVCGNAPLSTSEQFVQRDVGNGLFMLQGVASGLCITAQDDDAGAAHAMVQSPCTSQPDQEFRFEPTNDPYGNLVVQSSWMCMTVSGGASSIDSGQAIVEETCNVGDPTQAFMLHPQEIVGVANRNSITFGPMCFNVAASSTVQNASIVQWTCGPEPVASNMEFRRLDAGNGVFLLQSILSDLCVTVHGNDATADEFMVQYPCNDLPSQEFVFQPTSGGFGNLVVQNSGMCLTVSGGVNSIYSGQAIVQQPCVAGESVQEFMLEQM